MKYIKNLFLSIKEVLFMLGIQYLFLIISILIFGFNNSIIIGTIIVIVIELIYIIIKGKNNKFNFKISYFPYIILGIAVSTVYNMLIFKLKGSNNVTNIPIILNILCSGIIGPIFEELLFRYSLIGKLNKFNSKYTTIIMSSLIFSLCHTNINSIIFAFIIGAINGYLYIKKDNIIIPIIIHITANTMAIFLFNFNYIILILGIILLIISFLLLSRINNK